MSVAGQRVQLDWNQGYEVPGEGSLEVATGYFRYFLDRDFQLRVLVVDDELKEEVDGEDYFVYNHRGEVLVLQVVPLSEGGQQEVMDA